MREMKDSGIKWIGVIPSAWRTARVKNVAETMQSGGTPDSSNDTFYVDIEGGIPWVAITDMSTTPYVKDTNKHISEEGRKSKNLILFLNLTARHSSTSMRIRWQTYVFQCRIDWNKKALSVI